MVRICNHPHPSRSTIVQRHIYFLSDDRYTRQYEGRWKSGDYGYPFAYIREGWIYVIVSRQKERMDALKCKISDLR